jgi:hypothetical protein
MSTIIRVNAPGWTFSATGPDTAGASVLAGAPVAGVDTSGGGCRGWQLNRQGGFAVR